jgi:hypothetical protein
LVIAFSADGSVLAASQPDATTRFVDPETGTDWATLQRPDPRRSADLKFSPDQKLLIEMPFGDRGEPRIWRLDEIRHELAARGLDWPAHVLPARTLPGNSLPPRSVSLVLDDGNLASRHRARVLIAEAGDRKDQAARELLEQAVQLDPENVQAHNQLAWLLVTGPEDLRDPAAAVRLGRRTVQLAPQEAAYWNTLGVALYRDGQFEESIAALEKSLECGSETTAGFDWVFLALCQARLGNMSAATEHFQRARAWFDLHEPALKPLWRDEMASFLAEAAAAGLTAGNE